jgi:hypothetical protein
MTGNSRQEPPVASTNEYLLKQIKEDRADMVRAVKELGATVTSLLNGYDVEQDLQDQSECILDLCGDLVELSTKATYLSVRLAALEDMPRVG